MIPLIKLREDLRFARELLEMIDVLKSATSSQFRTFQMKRKGFDDFKFALEDFLAALGTERIAHPFLKEDKDLPKAVLMITSDEGFLGGLNTLVLTDGLEQTAARDEIIVMGERGSRYMSETVARPFTFLPGVGDDISYRRAGAVRDLLIGKFLRKEIGSALVVYPRFLSFTAQRVEVVRVLPSGDILVRKDDIKKFRKTTRPSVLVEPDRGALIDYLVRALMMQKFYDIFLDSKLSECSARIMHLEGSLEEIKTMNRRLMRDYFKHLHEKSDKNIREIFASRLRWREARVAEIFQEWQASVFLKGKKPYDDRRTDAA
ncbi:MAG: FoF1 ATP synthase subunit gamma [Candidatus Omnitrophota bacterium]|jgi:ATP synthase F1 gamma subunit